MIKVENSILEQIIKKAIDSGASDWQQFLKVQLEILKETGSPLPKGAELLKAYNNLVKNEQIDISPALQKILKFNSVRTISGVAPVAILTKPAPCPGECVYCPTEKEMPKSYLSDEPAVMRAVRVDFEAKQQVANRIAALEATGHNAEKIELIVMGGTFSCLPNEYKEEFIKGAFDGMNGVISPDLAAAQKLNETAEHRCIGLTLETRPDFITEEEVIRMRDLGCTRVELGVQSTNDEVLAATKRGHLTDRTVEATKLLKDNGIKVSYHVMPNLPGVTLEKDLEMFRTLFGDERFKPDQLKIYPCVAVEESELHQWYLDGRYEPYSKDELIKLLSDVKPNLPHYVRISRLFRDIPTPHIKGGIKYTNFRQMLKDSMDKQGLSCTCIRCREVKDANSFAEEPVLFIDEYKASGGTEYFISYEGPERKTIFAFLRLRINGREDSKALFGALNDAAIIREVHTYGRLTPIGAKGKVQHLGLGKQLIKLAEGMAAEKGLSKISVIAGIGVREYYANQGYSLKDGYMVKALG